MACVLHCRLKRNVMIVYFIVAYLIFTFLVTALAVNRRISMGNAFTLSFFLTPLLGLLAILKTDKTIKITHYATKYHCPRCQAEFNTHKEYCPSCLAEGVKVKPEQAEIKLAG